MGSFHIKEKELKKLNKIAELPYDEWWKEIISQEGEEMDYKIADFQKYVDRQNEPSDWGEPSDDVLREIEQDGEYCVDDYEEDYEDLRDVYDELGWSESYRNRPRSKNDEDWYQSTDLVDWFGEGDFES